MFFIGIKFYTYIHTEEILTTNRDQKEVIKHFTKGLQRKVLLSVYRQMFVLTIFLVTEIQQLAKS